MLPPHSKCSPDALCYVDAISSFSAPSGRPYNLTETSVTTTSLEISWTPPDPSRQNGIIQYYIVYVQQVEPETTSDSTTIYNSSSTSLSLTGLTPYTSHQVKVTAVTIAPGPNSTVELFRTEEDGKYSANNI